MASKWTCENSKIELTNRECWLVKCDGKYAGTILKYGTASYRYSIPDQRYTPQAYPSVARAMKAMRATLRWRRKKQRQQKPLDTDS